jgi:hypothetical protein
MTLPLRILASIFVLALAAPAAAQDYMWYAQAISQGPTGVSSTYFWSRGSSLRALTIIQGRPLLTMVHRDWYYVVDELSGKGLAIQRSTQALREDAQGLRPFAQEATLIVEQGAEKVRTETIQGRKVDVWRLTDNQARREVWTAAERPDIPMKVEIYDRGTTESRTIQYVDWSWTLKIPERFFRPDARIVLERLSYKEYLRKTTDATASLPVLYASLLHGRQRIDE